MANASRMASGRPSQVTRAAISVLEGRSEDNTSLLPVFPFSMICCGFMDVELCDEESSVFCLQYDLERVPGETSLLITDQLPVWSSSTECSYNFNFTFSQYGLSQFLSLSLSTTLSSNGLSWLHGSSDLSERLAAINNRTVLQLQL
ncbi:hypothetical protein KSP40_PGU016515 [Platanthera guangdongensis]|uniref:Uncharacterized protein n=1 Tax=Platanthera guangdongensis TaxID=2320717 RepID=A0ABR2LVS0_9ASPA